MFFNKRGSCQALKDLGLFKRAEREFAPGIPSKRQIDALPDIREPTNWTIAIQDHKAERAGRHYDLRLIDPATGKAHSWAIPKAMLPKPGKSVLAIQQPTHTAEYATTFGKNRPQKITSGYGKGTVRMHLLDNTEVYHSKPEEKGTRLRFNLYKSTGPEEYALIRAGKNQDLLVNKTLSRERLPHLRIGEKPKLKPKVLAKVDLDNNQEIMLPKYDGAHTYLDLNRPNKIPRLFSYRKPKRHTAGVIEHTHKVPLLLNTRTPKELTNTTLHAETIAVNEDGTGLPAKDIAGMLNATVPNSRRKQKELKAKLLPILLDVSRYRGKDVSTLPFSARYTLLKEIQNRLKLPIAEIARTPREKSQLLEKIRTGKHPLTREGVILRPINIPGPATKAKFRPDHDLYVREIFQATDRNGKPLGRAGGFTYSWSKKGPIVGRIGTGFDHETARDMLRNPERYKGRVAKIEAETKYRSGALSKPSFKEWHLDKGDIEK